ncbi:MAG: hypothetical protein WCB49_12635 [Gammaproteobacteria bacterium]
MRRTVLIGAAILVLGACTLLKPLTPEQRFGKEIVGSWIVAGDSSDYRLVPMHERFYGDGTYRIFWFADATCSKVVGGTHLDWKIQDGVLVSKITEATSPAYGHVGDVIKSRILSLTKNRMVLKSLDDGTTYARVRSTRCLAPKLVKI